MAKFWLKNGLTRICEALDIHNVSNDPGKVFIMTYSNHHNDHHDHHHFNIDDIDDVIGRTIVTKLLQTGYTQIRVGNCNSTMSPMMFKTTKNKKVYHADDDSYTDTDNSINSSINNSTSYYYKSNGIELVDFAWDCEETYTTALRGIKSVILHLPQDLNKYHNWYKHYTSFLRACKVAGVKHYVKLSSYLSNPKLYGDTIQCSTNNNNKMYNLLPKYVKVHKNCDEQLIRMIIPDEEHVTQMSYTILATTHSMSNPLLEYKNSIDVRLSSSLEKPKVYVLSNTANTNSSNKEQYGTNYISPNDVAEAVVRVVLSPKDHYNQYYTLFGRCRRTAITSSNYHENTCYNHHDENFYEEIPMIYRPRDINTIMSKYYNTSFDCIYVNDVSKYHRILLEKTDMNKCTTTTTTTGSSCIVEQLFIATGYEEYILSHPHTLLLQRRNDFETICHRLPESFTEYLTYTSK